MNYVGREPAPAGVILVGDTNPVGAIVWGHKAPDGSYLQLNGQVVSKTTYAELWTYAQGFLTADQTANPGLYRDVSGSTFAVPKLDGLFIRSTGVFDANRAAAALGVRQDDINKTHTHDVNESFSGGSSAAAAGGGGVSTTFATSASGGTEARPINVALVPCVKALPTILAPSVSLPQKDFELISDVTLTDGQAQQDFALAGFAAYRFVLSHVRPQNDGVNLIWRGSQNGGASFDATAQYHYSATGNDHTGVAQSSASGGSQQNQAVVAGGVSNDVNWGVSGEILSNNLSASRDLLNFQVSYWSNIGRFIQMSGFSVYLPAGTMNAIRFLMSAGLFKAGRILLYGMRGTS